MDLRPALAPLGLAALLAAGAPSVSLSLHLGRNSLDLLDSVAIGVVAHNAAPSPQTVRFAKPQEYVIEVVQDGRTIWSSLPASPPPNVTFPEHARSLIPGTTTIVVYDWNELTSGGWSPRGGTYLVRAHLLGETLQPSASVRLSFAAPLPAIAVATLKEGTDVTLAGKLDPTLQMLFDASGSAKLSRKLLGAPPGVDIAIRGYVTVHVDGTRTFTFERWAPLGAPLPTPTPTNKPLAMPTHR